MHVALRPAAAVLCMLTSAATAQTPTPPVQAEGRLIAVSDSIDVRDGSELKAGSWGLSPTANPDIYTAQLDKGEWREVCFISGPNSLCRTVGVGERTDFSINYKGRDYPTRIEGKFVPPAAKFDETYKHMHQGKVTVLVPEVYELVNVAIALTPYAAENQFLTMKDSDYHRELQTYFAPVASHPFVQWPAAQMRKDQISYFRNKMNAYSFEYDGDGRIVRSRIYDRTSFRGEPENTLLPSLAMMMQSFSDQSMFRRFYAAHRPLYQNQIDFIRDGLKFDRMVQWLQREFPAVKPYDHVKIIFSPLVYGSQSVTWIENNSFTELQPHINFPYEQSFTLPVSPAAKTLQRGNLLFTETNHGYINPTAEPYSGSISSALSERSVWARAGMSSDTYQGLLSLFLEYMNWGLVSLYYVDYAPAADLSALIAANEQNMKERRGFIRFPEFNQFLVMLYRERPKGKTIADLYPEIITWFAAHNSAPVPAVQSESSGMP